MSRRADPLTGTTEVGTVVIREDITQWQRLERVVVIGVTDGREEVVAEADSVGYRRIVRFPRALPTRSGSRPRSLPVSEGSGAVWPRSEPLPAGGVG